MSWFTELAGKAEALLNQVDQAASESLKDSGLKTPQKQAASSATIEPPSRVREPHVPYEPTVHTTKPGQGAAVAQVLVGRTPQSLVAKKQHSNEPIHTSTPRKSSSTSSVANDDKLLEFLNSPSNVKESVSSRPRTPQTQKSRSSSHATKSSSLPLSKPVVPVLSQPHLTSGNNDTVPNTPVTTEDESQQESSPPREEIELKDDAVMAVTVEESPPLDEVPSTDMPDSATMIEHLPKPDVDLETENSESLDKKEIGVLKQTISNYELENKLLKREINSLNEELAALLKKTTGHEERVSHYESEIHALREQASRTDHMIRQLRSHNEDLQASLEARDSQISVLRARLSEADRKVEEQQRQLAASDNEKQRSEFIVLHVLLILRNIPIPDLCSKDIMLGFYR